MMRACAHPAQMHHQQGHTCATIASAGLRPVNCSRASSDAVLQQQTAKAPAGEAPWRQQRLQRTVHFAEPAAAIQQGQCATLADSCKTLQKQLQHQQGGRQAGAPAAASCNNQAAYPVCRPAMSRKEAMLPYRIGPA